MLTLLRPMPRLSVGLGGILLGRSPESVMRMQEDLLPPHVWPFPLLCEIALAANICSAQFSRTRLDTDALYVAAVSL